jgi:hypothetical protein
LIPEAVYTQKALSTRKTIRYTNAVGTFDYHSIKPDLFFGYAILHKDNFPIMMAEMEKAILDFLYLNASIKSAKDIEQLRFNYTEIRRNLNWEKLQKYQLVFGSKILDKKVKALKMQLEHANTF